MLVLTRRIGESINIGGEATITVLDVNTTKKVRFGIESPHLLVRRAEVLERDETGDKNDQADSEDPNQEQ